MYGAIDDFHCSVKVVLLDMYSNLSHGVFQSSLIVQGS